MQGQFLFKKPTTAGGGGGNPTVFTFGTAINTPIAVQVNTAFPNISFAGGNIPNGTAATVTVPTSGGNILVSGTMSSGVFSATSGAIMPSNANTGSVGLTINTTGLTTNPSANVAFNISLVPVAGLFNKTIIFGTNGNQYSLVDTTNGTLIGSNINTIAPYTGGNFTKAINSNSAGTEIFKVDSGFGLVKLAFNNTTNVLSFVSSLALANAPGIYGMTYNETDDLAFVCTKNGSNHLIVQVIRASTMTLLQTLTFPNHQYASGECAYDALNNLLYVNGARYTGAAYEGASVLRITIDPSTGIAVGSKQWDYVGNGNMGSALALNSAGTRLVVGLQLSNQPINLFILNTSVFNSAASTYSFQGASIGLGANTLPTFSIQAAQTDVRTAEARGDKYVVGYGNGVSQTTAGDFFTSTITNYASPDFSEHVGLDANQTRFVQLGYNNSSAQVRNFVTGALVGSPITGIVSNPLAVLCV
jgi:hypothetical protein